MPFDESEIKRVLRSESEAKGIRELGILDDEGGSGS